MKQKEFDYFSFKAPSSQQSEADLSVEDIPPPSHQIIKPNDINYRHTIHSPPLNIFDHSINNRIANINNELEENIKRRIELQKQLETVRKIEKQKQQKDIFMAYNSHSFKETQQIATQFKNIEQQSDKIEQLVSKQRTTLPENIRKKEIENSKELLLKDDQPSSTNHQEKIVKPILQTLAAQTSKPIPLYTVPDQLKIQKLLRKVTFPEVPTDNLETLRKQVESLFAVHSPHSDLHYLLMAVYFHLQKHTKVRDHFKEIVMFKVHNPLSYWIAAEAQFALNNHELCLKLTQQCMNRLQDKYLPRFLLLKAKCYDHLGNYINSIVCYNQLIKIKPKISSYYLQRGLLYHRIGYYKQSKQDFTMFGLLNPSAQSLIKQKILSQPNEFKKKEYIAVLSKMY